MAPCWGHPLSSVLVTVIHTCTVKPFEHTRYTSTHTHGPAGTHTQTLSTNTHTDLLEHTRTCEGTTHTHTSQHTHTRTSLNTPWIFLVRSSSELIVTLHSQLPSRHMLLNPILGVYHFHHVTDLVCRLPLHTMSEGTMARLVQRLHSFGKQGLM